jgi:hypothetical protein
MHLLLSFEVSLDGVVPPDYCSIGGVHDLNIVVSLLLVARVTPGASRKKLLDETSD